MMMSTGAPADPTVAARFCHVCRYILVDTLNPTRHRDIECAYAEQYPEPAIAPVFVQICRDRYRRDRARAGGA